MDRRREESVMDRRREHGEFINIQMEDGTTRRCLVFDDDDHLVDLEERSTALERNIDGSEWPTGKRKAINQGGRLVDDEGSSTKKMFPTQEIQSNDVLERSYGKGKLPIQRSKSVDLLEGSHRKENPSIQGNQSLNIREGTCGTEKPTIQGSHSLDIMGGKLGKGKMVTQVKKETMRWDSGQTKFLCKFLVQQLRDGGMKADKTFKPTCLRQAAKAVREQFGDHVEVANVKNRLRTLKEKWTIVNDIIKNSSGLNVDFDKGLIEMDEATADEYIKAHPKAEPYVNKYIDNFQDMMIIFSDDKATGEFRMRSTDKQFPLGGDSCSSKINITTESDETFIDDDPLGGESSSSKKKPSKRRKDPEPAEIEVSSQLAKLIEAVNKNSASVGLMGEVEINKQIIGELMRWGGNKGIERSTLFEWTMKLTTNIELGKIFLALGDDMKMEWLQWFLSGGNST